MAFFIPSSYLPCVLVHPTTDQKSNNQYVCEEDQKQQNRESTGKAQYSRSHSLFAASWLAVL
jgi:hypothetical protein